MAQITMNRSPTRGPERMSKGVKYSPCSKATSHILSIRNKQRTKEKKIQLDYMP